MGESKKVSPHVLRVPSRELQQSRVRVVTKEEGSISEIRASCLFGTDQQVAHKASPVESLELHSDSCCCRLIGQKPYFFFTHSSQDSDFNSLCLFNLLLLPSCLCLLYAYKLGFFCTPSLHAAVKNVQGDDFALAGVTEALLVVEW